MNWIVAHIKWVMLVCGVATFTMVYAALAPSAALRSSFGESIEGPVAQIVVRNWGALIALMGVLLIYGAFRPASRSLILVVAGTSKLIFIALVLLYGRQFLAHQAGIAIAFDSVAVALFAWYLVATRNS